jgi:hypothetical protein
MPPNAARNIEPDTPPTGNGFKPNQPQGAVLRAANDDASEGVPQASNDNETETNPRFNRLSKNPQTTYTQPRQSVGSVGELRKDSHRRTLKTSAPENDNPRPRDTAIREAKKLTRPAPLKSEYINPSHPSTDQEFSQSYMQKGLQPSVGSVTPVRDVNVTYGKGFSTSPRNTTPVDQRRTDVEKKLPTKYTGRQSSETSQTSSVSQSRQLSKQGVSSKLGKFGKAAKLVGPTAILRKVSRRISIFNVSWVAALWLKFQIPIATVAIVSFGFMFFIEYTKATVEERFGFFGSLIIYALEAGYDTLNKALEFAVGFNLTYFEPTSIFFIANSAVLFIGWGTMFALVLIYTLSGTHAFSGKAQTLKIITFILAFALYFPPVLNLVPWALFWVLVIYLYPE